MATVNAESVLNFIQSAYQTIDRLHLSMEMLAVIALVVTVAFLLALREVAAWFFKIDGLKKDIRSLEDGIARLEHEIKTLQQNNGGIMATSLVSSLAAASAGPQATGAKLAIDRRRAEQFPINF